MTDSSTLVSPAPTPPSKFIQSEFPTDSSQTSQTSIDSIETATTPTPPTQPKNSRLTMNGRQASGTMIVPADHPEIELQNEEYGPNDARSFSPRRGIEDTERMVGGKRSLLKR